MTPHPQKLTAVVLCVMLGLSTACSPDEPASTSLRVLASSELTDMQSLLDELRRETGIELILDHQGSQDASNELSPGDYHHDLAWLSSDRYFQLKLQANRHTGPTPLSTRIMTSPVVIGVRPEVAEGLRRKDTDLQLSWADIADAAAAGQIRFGMADPSRSNSGLTALVGVATAATATGGALRPEDVQCDRLRGFYTGQTLTAVTSRQLIDSFIAHQDSTDAVIGYESVLLSLNASGKLHEPLEIVYPQDGMVLAEYPLLLLNTERRTDYDRVVTWLTSEPAQKKIMERTLRRPVDPNLPRDPRLLADIGNALFFPDQPEVIDKLLANYDPKSRTPGKIIFLLDFSGSMKGTRISALRSTFDALSGTDTSSSGKFVKFYRGEKLTLIRFGGQILAEQDFTITGQNDVDAMRAFLATDQFADHTAIWSALDHAYQAASRLAHDEPRGPVTVVLMTDGLNNAGIDLDQFLQRYESVHSNAKAVHTYTIRYGEADPAELDRVARTTGGHLIDAVATSLGQAFKEFRGCR